MKKISVQTREAVARAIDQFPSASALGTLMNVTYQAVLRWKKSGVPIDRCAELESLVSGAFQCEQLNEDFARVTRRPFKGGPPNGIYLSGPMTGVPELNFPAFNAEAARLRKAGFRVFNPAELVMPAGSRWAEFMRADIREMMSYATICLLPGWENSPGAMLEHSIASALSFRVMHAGDDPSASTWAAAA
jgi:hypothetical protein